MKYNKYIKKIGIEFEGFWYGNLYHDLRRAYSDLFSAAHTDGSLNNENISMEYDPVELVTEPLSADQIGRAIGVIKSFRDTSKYITNRTCGLHYHISFDKKAYGALVKEDFYHVYADMFKEKFSDVYRDRKNNRYCVEKVGPEHFRRQSGDKYHFINYQLNAFKTLEFRAYGGALATLEGLENCIQSTIDLVDQYLKTFKEKSVKKLTLDDLDLEMVNKKAGKVMEFKLKKKHKTIILDGSDIARFNSIGGEEHLYWPSQNYVPTIDLVQQQINQIQSQIDVGLGYFGGGVTSSSEDD